MGKVRYDKWIGGVSAALLISAAISGCASNTGDTQGNLKKFSGPVKVKTLDQTRIEEQSAPSIVPITQIHNTSYVPLDAVAQAIGFHGEWLDNGKFGVGDSDPAWSFQAGDSAVDTGEGASKMPAPAVKQNNRLYVPASSLQGLFGNAADFRSDGQQVSFFPQADDNRTGAADDLGQPFQDGQTGTDEASEGNFRSLSSSSNGDHSDVIQQARRYLGVPYDFGAGSYSKTHRFDCSSYTKYIFAKFGVNLPRTARAQAKVGRSVSRSNLKKGDLVFFSVPGRFKSDSTVGHVGIYMGSGQMINANSAPKDGVQITNINKQYWRDHFLSAKRVL